VRYLTWLGLINCVSREGQQVLGVRAGGGRSLIDEEGAEDAADLADPADEPEERAGTHIAA
jgi:hypothetical protein